MGLDVSHDAFSGAYSAFNRMRIAVCEATGGGEVKENGETFFAVGGNFRFDQHPGLLEFLSHSDCDGEIHPAMCRLVARDLRKVAEVMPESSDFGHIAAVGGMRAAVIKFAEGCERAADAGEPLVFA